MELITKLLHFCFKYINLISYELRFTQVFMDIRGHICIQWWWWFSHTVMFESFAILWAVACQAPPGNSWDFPAKNIGAISFSRGYFRPRDRTVFPESPTMQVDSLSLSHQGNPFCIQ